MSEIQISQNKPPDTNPIESQPGPTDSYYRYLKEKGKREQSGRSTDTLLSQELALVRDNVVIADLNLLRAEGTFSLEERNIPKDQARYDQVLSLQKLEGDDSMYSLKDTDWEVIDEFILKYFQDTDAQKSYDFESIKDLDPAMGATLAYEIAKHFMVYDQEMRMHPAGEKSVEANTKSANQLLTEGKGVCRHFTKVAIAIYDRLKQIDGSGSLTDTILLPVGNELMDDVSEPHAYCILIAKRSETVFSVGDPTFLSTLNREVHSDLRLASLISTLIEKNLLDALDIREETLLALIDEELGRLDKWLNFTKKLSTQKAQEGVVLNNENFIKEQGFDERAAHFLEEASSTLQIIYALNTAKSMLQSQDRNKIITPQQVEESSQAMFDWIMKKSKQLPESAVASGVNRMLNIAPNGTINLKLLASIIRSLTELSKPIDEPIKQALREKLQARLNWLKNEQALAGNSDPWANPQMKYANEQIDEVQELLDNLMKD